MPANEDPRRVAPVALDLPRCLPVLGPPANRFKELSGLTIDMLCSDLRVTDQNSETGAAARKHWCDWCANATHDANSYLAHRQSMTGLVGAITAPRTERSCTSIHTFIPEDGDDSKPRAVLPARALERETARQVGPASWQHAGFERVAAGSMATASDAACCRPSIKLKGRGLEVSPVEADPSWGQAWSPESRAGASEGPDAPRRRLSLDHADIASHSIRHKEASASIPINACSGHQ